MRGRSVSPVRQAPYRYTEEEEEYRRRRQRPRSRCRRSGSPCKCCPPLQPSQPSQPSPLPTIQVMDRTTQDSDPHGRHFIITLLRDTTAGDIMHSLAPRGGGCVVHVCWGEGRRCLLDERDVMWEVAKGCWLEVVDA